MPANYRKLIANFSLNKGKEAVEKVISLYKTSNPFILCSRLGIKIILSHRKPKIYSLPIYSIYYSNPPTIVLNTKRIKLLVKKIRLAKVDFSLNLVQLYQIFIAHEIFHHLERQYFNIDELDILPNYKLLLQKPQNISLLLEIASYSFCQHLLKLDFFPGILKLLP